MSESLGQTSYPTWPEAKEDALAALRRAGQTLLEVAVQRAASRAESVLENIEAHAVDSADHAVDLARQHAATRPVEATTDVQGDPEHAGDGEGLCGLMGVLRTLLKAGLQLVVDAVERVADRLKDLVAGGGPLLAAGLGAGIAALVGKNPLWGAIKGGFSALSPWGKALVIIALVLAALLAPVTILVALIAVIVIVVVLAVKSRSSNS